MEWTRQDWVGYVGLDCTAGLGWTRLDWVRLGWTGLDKIEMDQVELDWTQFILGRVGLGCIRLHWA